MNIGKIIGSKGSTLDEGGRAFHQRRSEAWSLSRHMSAIEMGEYEAMPAAVVPDNADWACRVDIGFTWSQSQDISEVIFSPPLW